MKSFYFLIIVLLLSCEKHPEPLHAITGPVTKSQIAPIQPASVSQLDRGEKSRLALFIAEDDCHWQDLAAALNTVGIPVRVTKDFDQALKHQSLFLYPYVSGKSFSEPQLKKLHEFVKQGGQLFATHVLVGGLQEIFGFSAAESSRGKSFLEYTNDKTLTQLLGSLADEEKKVTLKAKELSIGTTEYKNAKQSLAKFDDGSTAITYNKMGTGTAIAFGVDVGDLAYLGHTARAEELSPYYVNQYTPVLDTFLFLIKSVYQSSGAPTLGIAPHAENLVILLSHDVDFVQSVPHSVEYARAEADLGIKSTFFMQTKYIKDFNDNVFFTKKDVDILKNIRALGMEIGSHSVSHSLLFNKFPVGSGDESYPTYEPFIKNAAETTGGTILGELRVSKFLLDNLLPEQKTVSFRAGDLRNPDALPQALLATGYQFDSSVTANMSLTHLPVKLSYNSRGQQHLAAYRFPVTIEDEKKPELLERLDSSVSVCEKISRRGGVCTVLLHPNITGTKLEFVKKFVASLKDKALFSTFENFGRFWAARDQVQLDIIENKIILNSPNSISSLTLEFATLPQIIKTEPEGLIKEKKGNKLVLNEFKGQAILFKP